MPKLTTGYAAPLQPTNPFPQFAPQPGGPYDCAGAPSNGTSCVQTVTIGGTPTGGTFTLLFGGLATGTIAWTATDATLASNIANALNALPNVGASGTVGAVGTGSSGIGTYTVTFQNQNAALTVPAIYPGSNNMAGTAPTVAVAVTTAGTTATLRGAVTGTQVTDYVGVKEWTNTGSPTSPTFVRSDSFTAVIPLTATTVTTGGGMGSWQPVEGGPVVITRCVVYVATASTGAANVSAGETTTATTSSTNLINAASVHTTGSTIDNITNQVQTATAAESGLIQTAVLMPAGNFVTFTGSASTAGLVATAYVEYFKP